MWSMRSKPATRKLTEGELKVKGYHQCLEIVSTDVMKFNGKDVDGNIAMSGVYIPKTSYGAEDNGMHSHRGMEEQH